MIKYFIWISWWCLFVIDASSAAAPSGGVPDLQSACARIDIWGSSEVAKALCGAVGTSIKSQGRPVCTCSRCALSEKRWNHLQSKIKQRLTFKKVSFQFFLLFTTTSFCQEFEMNHQLLRPHFLEKMIYLADHCPEKNSDEYTESIRWFYLFCDRMISTAKRVHICWINYHFVSAPNLSHSSVCFRLK
jgi:hypothetical protein